MILKAPFSHELPAVELVDGVVGIAVVLKLDEAVPVLERDLLDAAELPEEPVHVGLPRPVGQPAHVHAGRHPARTSFVWHYGRALHSGSK